MKNKRRPVLSAVVFLCLCLCLTGCGKIRVTADTWDKIKTALELAAEKAKDAKPADSSAKDSGQAALSSEAAPAKPADLDYEMGVEPFPESDQPSVPAPAVTTPAPAVTTPVPAEKTPVPAETTPVPSAPVHRSPAQEYADYIAMSPEQQYDYFLTFDSPEAFLNWFNAAKAAYDSENQVIVLEPGMSIDLGGN